MTWGARRPRKTHFRSSLGRERGFPGASLPLCRGEDVPERWSVLAGIRRADRREKDPGPGACSSPQRRGERGGAVGVWRIGSAVLSVCHQPLWALYLE